jgi:hypothetical protein
MSPVSSSLNKRGSQCEFGLQGGIFDTTRTPKQSEQEIPCTHRVVMRTLSSSVPSLNCRSGSLKCDRAECQVRSVYTRNCSSDVLMQSPQWCFFRSLPCPQQRKGGVGKSVGERPSKEWTALGERNLVGEEPNQTTTPFRIILEYAPQAYP